MDKQLTDKIVQVFQDYLGENLISVILFGSQARSESTKTSDYDLFIIANNLPQSQVERSRFINRPLYENNLECLSVLAKGPEEFLKDISPLYLDLSIDGIVLFDRDFITSKIKRLKEIINTAGLRRIKDDGEYHWSWLKYPKGEWEITWGGFHEL
jgi:predicted nucleotidyltransferase